MTEHPLLLSAPMVRAALNAQPDVWPPRAIDTSKPFKSQTRRLVKNLRVRLRHDVGEDPSPVRAGWPLVAKAGVYCAKVGRTGAVSIDVDGIPLGVKPGEFDFLCPYSSGPTTLTYESGAMTWQVEPGDGVWFRETWQLTKGNGHRVVYRADVDTERWPPSVEITPATRWRTPIYMPRHHCRLTARIRRLRLEFLQDITPADIGAEGMPVDYSVNDRPDVLECEQRLAFAKGWDALNAKRGAPFASNPLVWAIDFERTT